MELRHLRYFMAVAEEENITRAAARLHVSQPPLSRQIRDLEEELGVALFHREAKRVRLTEAGRVFLMEVTPILRRLENAVDIARAVAQGDEGEIHVGFAPSLTVEILPRALRSFQEMHAGVKVQLHDLSTQEMLSGLRDFSLDVALIIRAPRTAMKGLIFEELSRYAVCLAAHPAHPLARAERVGLEQVAGERLIAYNPTHYPEYHQWLKSLFQNFRQTPEIAETHESSTGLIASVEAGRGVSLVQQGFESLAGPRLSILPLDPPPPPFVAGLAFRKTALSKAATDFITAARQSVTPKI